MDKTNNTLVEKIIDHVKEMQPGTVIPHLVVEDWLGMKRAQQGSAYYMLLSRAKRDLIRRHGLFLQTRHRVGYAIVPRGREILQVVGEFSQGVKRMGQAVNKGNHIRADLIEDNTARQLTLDTTQVLATQHGMVMLGIQNLMLPQAQLERAQING